MGKLINHDTYLIPLGASWLQCSIFVFLITKKLYNMQNRSSTKMLKKVLSILKQFNHNN